MRVSGEEKLPSVLMSSVHDQGPGAGLTRAFHGRKGTQMLFDVNIFIVLGANDIRIRSQRPEEAVRLRALMHHFNRRP